MVKELEKYVSKTGYSGVFSCKLFTFEHLDMPSASDMIDEITKAMKEYEYLAGKMYMVYRNLKSGL